jgi:hypothetical protein
MEQLLGYYEYLLLSGFPNSLVSSSLLNPVESEKLPEPNEGTLCCLLPCLASFALTWL